MEGFIQKFYVFKAYFRLWVARTLLYRKNDDKYEFSGLLSPTVNELQHLCENRVIHTKYQRYLIDCRNKVGHHGKYEKVLVNL